MTRSFIIFWLLFLVSAGASTQPLSIVEKQNLAQINHDGLEAINLLEKVVNINSGTMNFDGLVSSFPVVLGSAIQP